MSASAGRVLLLFKGQYDGTVQYNPLDVVKYGVSSYVCILQTTGNLPTNTTYWQILAEGVSNVSPEAIGIGYGISSDSGSARTATLSDYNLTPNGIVAVTFGADVPANATLNINSQGAKPIYFRGSAIVANVIKGGDTVTFAYDGTHYDILCIDGGAGHKILNSAGTELTQRDALQASDGLEFVDDSTNQRTKVKMNLPIVSNADWNAMTEQERTAYKASHYRFGVEIPDTSGVINAEYMRVGWENPNTTQAFTSQNVTLSSADYDFLLVICSSAGGFICKKGDSLVLTYATSGSGSPVNYLRTFTRNSDTSYAFGDAKKNNQTVENTVLIPIVIYLVKFSFQFKVNAIANELSTRADHCFLDDETTTVEDALTYKDVYSTDEHVVGKWIDGSILYEKTIDFGALPNTTVKTVAHNISNLSKIIQIGGVAIGNGQFLPLPWVSNVSSDTYNVRLNGTATSIDIYTNANMSGYLGYVTIRYTKTS